MQLILQDTSIKYAGKTLPKDTAPIKIPEVNPDIRYGQSTLPKDAQQPQVFVDTINTPGYINIGGIVLPPDTTIAPIEGKKLIPATDILDGVTWFERVMTKATKMEFNFTLRMQTQSGANFRNTNNVVPGPGRMYDIFAQEYLYDVWFNIFKPNSVLNVQNSLLNNLGITQLIIEECHIAGVKGTTNIPGRILAYENVPGQSLLME